MFWTNKHEVYLAISMDICRDFFVMKSTPVISVIICTIMKTSYLSQCIESVLTQSLPCEYEVILVNNRINTEEKIDGVVQTLSLRSDIRSSIEPKEGLSYARNHGASIARGEILVFLDDDAIAQPEWLSAILKTYQDYPDAVSVGGKIDLFWESPAPEWLHPALNGYLGELNYGSGIFPIQHNQRLGGGNFSITKSWFEQCGGFSTRLGRDHNSLLSGEETELFIRIWERGGKIYYNSDAAVMHPALRNRMNKDFFRKRVYWGGRSAAITDKIHSPSRVFMNAVPMLVRFPYHLFFSRWYEVTGRHADAFLWETFYRHSLGYLAETLGGKK